MCGNVGVIIGKNNFTPLKFRTIFKNLLIIDQLRGVHGTGIFTVSSNHKIKVYKDAVNASKLLSRKKVDNIISVANNVLAGHNRHATQGSHIKKNTHPFTKGHVTMFHNGTLHDVRELEDNNFDVDSKAIANTLYKKGVIHTLEKIDGAFALVWYDAKTKLMNFARNSERELYLGYSYSTNGKVEGIIWASEKEMIELACARNNLQIDKIIKLKDGIWLTIDPLTLKETETKFKYIEQNKYFDYSNFYSTTTYRSTLPSNSYLSIALNRYSTVRSIDGTMTLTGKINNKIVLLKGLTQEEAKEYINKHQSYEIVSDNGTVIHLKKPEQNYLEVTEYRLGPNNSLILEDEYNELIKNGCHMCGADLTELEDYEIQYDNLEHPLCEGCASEEELKKPF